MSGRAKGERRDGKVCALSLGAGPHNACERQQGGAHRMRKGCDWAAGATVCRKCSNGETHVPAHGHGHTNCLLPVRNRLNGLQHAGARHALSLFADPPGMECWHPHEGPLRGLPAEGPPLPLAPSPQSHGGDPCAWVAAVPQPPAANPWLRRPSLYSRWRRLHQWDLHQ